MLSFYHNGVIGVADFRDEVSKDEVVFPSPPHIAEQNYKMSTIGLKCF